RAPRRNGPPGSWRSGGPSRPGSAGSTGRTSPRRRASGARRARRRRLTARRSAAARAGWPAVCGLRAVTARGAPVGGWARIAGANLVLPEWVAAMSEPAVVFALSNPDPEIMPEDVPPNVRVVATGRSDYPNQINNVLAFPGFFRGLLDSRARSVTDRMKVAAAEAIAGVVGELELSEEYIVPSVLDRRVAPAVAAAVERAAIARGVPRRP